MCLNIRYITRYATFKLKTRRKLYHSSLAFVSYRYINWSPRYERPNDYDLPTYDFSIPGNAYVLQGSRLPLGLGQGDEKEREIRVND